MFTAILRLHFLVLPLLLVYNASMAQQKRADSLQFVLKGLGDDTIKVNTLLELSREYYWTANYKEALQSATSAQQLASKINYRKGEGNAWISSGHTYLRKGEYDSALHHFTRAYQVFTTLAMPIELANAHLYLGQTYDLLASYKQALEHYKVALDIIEKNEDDVLLVKILNSMGITHYNKGSYETAISYYLQSLKINERFSDRRFYASTLNNIGVVHMTLMQYEEALKYFLLYLQTMRKLQHTQGIAVALLNVGEANFYLKNSRQAILYLDSALMIYQQISDKRGLSLVNSNLGDCYRSLNEYASAEKHYKEAIEIAESIKSEEPLIKALIGSAEMYLKTGNTKKTALALDQATATAKRVGSVLWLEKAYLFQSKLDSANGNYKDAYTWYKQYAQLSDSLFNERKSQQVAQMTELFESEKKDKEILLLQEAKKLEELKASSNKKLFAISVVFLILVIAGILYWLYHKFKHAVILQRKNDKISEALKELKILMDRVELQNKMLAAKNETLEDLHREKDGMIGVVAHDLRSPLNKIAGLTQILKESKNISTEDEAIIRLIQQVCKEGNGLIRDLLDINHIENCEDWSGTEINLADYVSNLVVQYKHNLQKKELNLVFECSTSARLVTDVHYLTRILDNIITNAIKFSPLQRNIYLTIAEENDNAIIRIKDEGPGFHENDLPHLFRKFKKLTARPTAGESSTGLGLSIVKTLTEKIKGSIHVESEWGKGAAFILSLPLVTNPAVQDNEKEVLASVH